jgi:hypothetical protein
MVEKKFHVETPKPLAELSEVKRKKTGSFKTNRSPSINLAKWKTVNTKRSGNSSGSRYNLQNLGDEGARSPLFVRERFLSHQ